MYMYNRYCFHIDKEKPHLHLLSTHIYICDYNTSFVNRPRQLVAIVTFTNVI